MLCALIVYSFLLLSNIPLYGYTKICFTIYLLSKDFRLVYSLGGVKYCGYLCIHFCVNKFSLLVYNQ